MAAVVVFSGGSSIRRCSMLSVMDHDERTGGRRKEWQCNNQPA